MDKGDENMIKDANKESDFRIFSSGEAKTQYIEDKAKKLKAYQYWLNDENQLEKIEDVERKIDDIKNPVIEIVLTDLSYEKLELFAKMVHDFLNNLDDNIECAIFFDIKNDNEYALILLFLEFCNIFFERAEKKILFSVGTISNNNKEICFSAFGCTKQEIYNSARAYSYSNFDAAKKLLTVLENYSSNFEDETNLIEVGEASRLIRTPIELSIRKDLYKYYEEIKTEAQEYFLIIYSKPNDNFTGTLFQEKCERSLNAPLNCDSNCNSSNDLDFISGCKLENVHVRLGAKIHIENFYEAEILFHNANNVNNFAYLIALDIKNQIKKNEDIFLQKYSGGVRLIGYESYSELLIRKIQTFLKEHYINIDIRVDIYFNDNKDSGNDLAELQKTYLPILIVPIGSTLSTFYKIIKKFNIENDSSYYNYVLVLVRNKREIESEKNNIENNFWTFDAGESNNMIKLREAYNSTHSNIRVKYLLDVEGKWYKAEKCPLCNPEHAVEERAIFHVDKTSTLPKIVFDLFKSNRKGFNESFLKANPARKEGLLIDFKQENMKRLSFLEECIKYGHLKSENNHFIYYIDTREYVKRVKNDLLVWAKQLKIAFQRKYDFNNCFNILVSPLNSTNGDFLTIILENLFGQCYRFFHFSIRDTLREDVRAKFKKITKEFIYNDEYSKAQNKTSKIKCFYIDDIIISGDTFGRSQSLLRMLLEEGEIRKENIFDAVVTLINRNSFDSVNHMVSKPNEDFYSFLHLNIPTLKINKGLCPNCELDNSYEDIMKRTVNEDLKTMFRDCYNKQKLRTISEYDALYKKKEKYIQENQHRHAFLRLKHTHIVNSLFDDLYTFKKLDSTERNFLIQKINDLLIKEITREVIEEIKKNNRPVLKDKTMQNGDMKSLLDARSSRINILNITEDTQKKLFEIIDSYLKVAARPMSSKSYYIREAVLKLTIFILEAYKLGNIDEELKNNNSILSEDSFTSLKFILNILMNEVPEKIFQLKEYKFKKSGSIFKGLKRKLYFDLLENIAFLDSTYVIREDTIDFIFREQNGLINEYTNEIIEKVQEIFQGEIKLVLSKRSKNIEWSIIEEAIKKIIREIGFIELFDLSNIIKDDIIQEFYVEIISNIIWEVFQNTKNKRDINSILGSLEKHKKNVEEKSDQIVLSIVLNKMIYNLNRKEENPNYISSIENSIQEHIKEYLSLKYRFIAKWAVTYNEEISRSVILDNSIDLSKIKNDGDSIQKIKKSLWLENTTILFDSIRSLVEKVKDSNDYKDSSALENYKKVYDGYNKYVERLLEDWKEKINLYLFFETDSAQNEFSTFYAYLDKFLPDIIDEKDKKDKKEELVRNLIGLYISVDISSEEQKVKDLRDMYRSIATYIMKVTYSDAIQLFLVDESNDSKNKATTILWKSNPSFKDSNIDSDSEKKNRLLHELLAHENSYEEIAENKSKIKEQGFFTDYCNEKDKFVKYLSLRIPIQLKRKKLIDSISEENSSIRIILYYCGDDHKKYISEIAALLRIEMIVFMKNKLIEMFSKDYAKISSKSREYYQIKPFEDPLKKPIHLWHLTDIHYSELNKEMIDKGLEKLFSAQITPDLIAITGDIIYVADQAIVLENRYNDFSKTLKQLLANKYEDEWDERILIVPGNHDYSSMNEGISQNVARSFIATTPPSILSETNANIKFAYYLNFASDFMDRLRIPKVLENDLCFFAPFKLMNLNFILLNTAATSSSNRQNRVGIKKTVLEKLKQELQKRKSPTLNIALMHHTPAFNNDYLVDKGGEVGKIMKPLIQVFEILFKVGLIFSMESGEKPYALVYGGLKKLTYHIYLIIQYLYTFSDNDNSIEDIAFEEESSKNAKEISIYNVTKNDIIAFEISNKVYYFSNNDEDVYDRYFSKKSNIFFEYDYFNHVKRFSHKINEIAFLKVEKTNAFMLTGYETLSKIYNQLIKDIEEYLEKKETIEEEFLKEYGDLCEEKFNEDNSRKYFKTYTKMINEKTNNISEFNDFLLQCKKSLYEALELWKKIQISSEITDTSVDILSDIARDFNASNEAKENLNQTLEILKIYNTKLILGGHNHWAKEQSEKELLILEGPLFFDKFRRKIKYFDVEINQQGEIKSKYQTISLDEKNR